MPPETIPRPRNPSTRIINIDGNRVSLATQMRLDGSRGNRRVYFDIVHNTGMLCQEYFPFKESMSGGWKITPILRVLAPKLLKKFPILHNYVDQWPIATMISRHYRMCQCGAKNGLVRSAPGQSSPVEKIVRPNASTRSMGALGSKGAGGLSFNLRSDRFQDSARYKRSGSNGRNHHDREATPSPSSSPTLTSEASVAQFLSTLAQDLSHLLPIFIDHGVGDGTSLRNMLRMNNWRAWMYAWVKEGVLTELQFQMIIDGLKKLV